MHLFDTTETFFLKNELFLLVSLWTSICGDSLFQYKKMSCCTGEVVFESLKSSCQCFGSFQFFLSVLFLSFVYLFIFCFVLFIFIYLFLFLVFTEGVLGSSWPC